VVRPYDRRIYPISERDNESTSSAYSTGMADTSSSPLHEGVKGGGGGSVQPPPQQTPLTPGLSGPSQLDAATRASDLRHTLVEFSTWVVRMLLAVLVVNIIYGGVLNTTGPVRLLSHFCVPIINTMNMAINLHCLTFFDPDVRADVKGGLSGMRRRFQKSPTETLVMASAG
jgi:hypothetical protein